MKLVGTSVLPMLISCCASDGGDKGDDAKAWDLTVAVIQVFLQLSGAHC